MARLTRRLARLRVRTIEPGTLEIVDPDGPPRVVQHDPGGQRVELDDQSVRVPCRHVEHSLATADAAVTVGGERREADAFGRVVDPVDIVGIGSALRQPAQPLPEIAAIVGHLADRGHQHLHEVVVAECGARNRLLGRQPARIAVAGAIDTERVQPLLHRSIAAILELAKLRVHGIGRPARIPGQRRDVLPVGLVRVDEDHCIVRGAAAERAGARVEHTLRSRLRITRLPRRVGIVLDVEIPAQRLVLRGERVKGGHVVVVGQAVRLGHAAHPALEPAWITTRFEEEDTHAGLGKAGGDGSTASARADDDVVERLPFHARSPQSVLRKAIRSCFSASPSLVPK